MNSNYRTTSNSLKFGLEISPISYSKLAIEEQNKEGTQLDPASKIIYQGSWALRRSQNGSVYRTKKLLFIFSVVNNGSHQAD